MSKTGGLRMTKIDFNDLMNSNVYGYYNILLEKMYRTSPLIYFMDLEDYKQEQHINTIKRLKGYNDKYALSTFIRLITDSKHKMMLREYKTDKRKTNNPQNLLYLDSSSEVDEKLNLHELLTINDEVDNDITFNIIDVMDKNEQTMIGLILMEYKKQDIAKLMGVSRNTISNRLNSLRNKLRYHFEKIGITYYNK